jgi:hypothetical protein
VGLELYFSFAGSELWGDGCDLVIHEHLGERANAILHDGKDVGIRFERMNLRVKGQGFECLSVWVFGWLGVWVFGCLGCVGVWVCGCLGVWVFRVFGCLGCLGFTVYGLKFKVGV